MWKEATQGEAQVENQKAQGGCHCESVSASPTQVGGMGTSSGTESSQNSSLWTVLTQMFSYICVSRQNEALNSHLVTVDNAEVEVHVDTK